MSFEADAFIVFQSAQEARSMLDKAMVDFQAACLCSNWGRSEVERTKAKDALDAFFDHVATMHRMANDG